MILAFLALAWLLGIAAAAFTSADPAAALAAAGLLAAASFAFRPRASTIAWAALGAALIFTASWRYDSTRPPDQPAGIARFNDGDAIRFRALVDSEPDDRGSSTLYRLSVREALIEDQWRPESGGVLLRADAFPRYDYGDLLELEGKLETPPTLPDFDYREYLLRRGVGSLVAYPDQVRLLATGQGNPLQAALIDVRERLSTGLSDVLPEPEAALAAGIFLGARSDIPQDLKDDMNTTGTSHLVAVSGQNVTLVAALLIAVLAWAIGLRPAAWLALAGIIGYAALVGAQPSVLRAAVMGGLYVVSVALGRQNSAAAALLLAAGGMTAYDPQLAHDVSFQLSFAATLGLITFSPLLQARLAALVRAPEPGSFSLRRAGVEMAAVTLAAIAFTLPITAVNFHRVSLAAPFANLFVVPAFIAVAFTAAPAAVAGALLSDAGRYLVWLAWPPAAYMVTAVRLFADFPLASIELRGVGSGHAIGYYSVLLAGVWLLSRRPLPQPEHLPSPTTAARRPLLPASGLVLIFGLSSLLLWLVITAPISGRLTVTFLDVGQGDAILIQDPAGHRILVDGGPSEEDIAAALGRHLPFYDRRIDLIVLTHPQEDHIGGLPAVLDRYDVGGVLASPVQADSAVYRTWRDAVRAAGVPYVEAGPGQWADLGDGARLQVLGPTPALLPPYDDQINDASVVLRLDLGPVAVLLTGDMSSRAETDLIRRGTDLHAAVLKVAHHGSDTSTSSPFLQRVRPLVDVISVGARNRYGHPSAEVLDRLQHDLILRTDQRGDITVSTDGRRLWIDTQHSGN